MMRNRTLLHSVRYGIAIGAVACSMQARANSDAAPMQLATGQYITPTAPRAAVQQLLNPGLAAYPDFVAGEAVRLALSPDGTTLAVLCAGQNSLYKTDGTIDVDGVDPVHLPLRRERRAPRIAGADAGDPADQLARRSGFLARRRHAVRGGRHVTTPSTPTPRAAGAWARSATIALGHAGKGVGIGVSPNAAVSASPPTARRWWSPTTTTTRSASIDTATGTIRYEHDLRPFFAGNEGTSGGVGGTFPFAVVVKGNGTAYVSSDRDREVVVDRHQLADGGSSDQAHQARRQRARHDARRTTARSLFVAQDNADQVAVIDTVVQRASSRRSTRAVRPTCSPTTTTVTTSIATTTSAARYTGAATFAVTLSPDGSTLYAVNSGSNSIAVIPLARPTRLPGQRA